MNPPINMGFLRSLRLDVEKAESKLAYPFSIPALSNLKSLELHPEITYLIGENGAGKSTLIEAIAIAAGMNAEGGSRNMTFETHATHSPLCDYLKLTWNPIGRPKDTYFLRAESMYNIATWLEKNPGTQGPGDFHKMSHGEFFLTLLNERFRSNGLYILDEPEAALSPSRQLSALAAIHQLILQSSQFIIATHSPIMMAYPSARILQLGDGGIEEVEYEDTEHFTVTRNFLQQRERMLRILLDEE